MLILVTRPQKRCQETVAKIENHGFQVAILPMIAIEPIKVSSVGLPELECCFFTSVYAVEYFTELRPSLAPNVRLFTIGNHTKIALSKLLNQSNKNSQSIHCTASSETMLAYLKHGFVSEMTGLCIGYFSGQGGRRVLSNYLRSLSPKSFRRFSLYRRVDLIHPVEQAAEKLVRSDLYLGFSNQSINNLSRQITKCPQQIQTTAFGKPLWLMSERNKKQAEKLGFTNPVIIKSLEHGLEQIKATKSVPSADKMPSS